MSAFLGLVARALVDQDHVGAHQRAGDPVPLAPQDRALGHRHERVGAGQQRGQEAMVLARHPEVLLVDAVHLEDRGVEPELLELRLEAGRAQGEHPVVNLPADQRDVVVARRRGHRQRQVVRGDGLAGQLLDHAREDGTSGEEQVPCLGEDDHRLVHQLVQQRRLDVAFLLGRCGQERRPVHRPAVAPGDPVLLLELAEIAADVRARHLEHLSNAYTETSRRSCRMARNSPLPLGGEHD